MAKTRALRAAITAKLRERCEFVWFDHAEFKQEPAGPYLVYALEELSHDDGMILCELEVNAVLRGKDTTSVEELCDEIQADLDHWLYLGEEVEFSAYLEKRQAVPSDDRSIMRRRMTFTLRMFERR